jgi:PIN domain nuclease of toxin-antitoxin system
MPTTSDPDLLLLDTHVWLWVVAGSSELSGEVRHTVDRAVAAGTLRIAAISLWEIALLASRGRIVLRWLIPLRQSIRSVRKSRSKAMLCQTDFTATRQIG